MKQIPTLFSTAMVQAILAGRKTMTRRILKPPPQGTVYKEHNKATYSDTDWGHTYKCPYGRPGDILWVRETWEWMEGFAGSGYYVFKADFNLVNGEWVKPTPKKFHDEEVVRKWRPSIHMPKEAARIWLEVTDIRVERLQDISEEDAIAEGAQKLTGARWKSLNALDTEFRDYTHKDGFECLWQSINGTESWDANPWVWVVSFKILSTTGIPELLTEKTTS